MTSAWGVSWGNSWGISWGFVNPPEPPRERPRDVSWPLLWAKQAEARQRQATKERIAREARILASRVGNELQSSKDKGPTRLRRKIKRIIAREASLYGGPVISDGVENMIEDALRLSKQDEQQAAFDEQMRLLEMRLVEMMITGSVARMMDDEIALMLLLA